MGRTPDIDLKLFSERREKLTKQLNGAALILPANTESLRNADSDYIFRQDSSFYYLTGFEEPDAILVIRPGETPETMMFVRPKNPEMETWTGFRYGPEGVEQSFGIEKAYPLEDFRKMAPKILAPAKKVYYRLFHNRKMDTLMAEILEEVRTQAGRTGRGLQPVLDPSNLLSEMRVIKSPIEIALMETACDIGADAHLAAMKFVQPGVNEREVRSILLHTMLMKGASGESFNSIVASGNNATTLHYTFNDQRCLDGDLVLIDAGAEYHYYASDITRTFPIGGRFSTVQKAVYQGVLDVQKKMIEMVRPGVSIQFLKDAAIRLLTEAMMDLGLFAGRADDIIAAKEYTKYYPHSIGHWLGMDVHDVGLYTIDNDSRVLEPNMVITIEPGLYIPATSNAPKELRGIGVRIEDDVLVTHQGNRVLTDRIPKEIRDLEH